MIDHLDLPEVDLEKLINQVEHAPLLGELLRGSGICCADSEAGHDAFAGLLQGLARVTRSALSTAKQS